MAALKQRGVTVEYIIKDNEGHGFVNEENRFDFYEAMERFLRRCLRPAVSGRGFALRHRSPCNSLRFGQCFPGLRLYPIDYATSRKLDPSLAFGGRSRLRFGSPTSTLKPCSLASFWISRTTAPHAAA